MEGGPHTAKRITDVLWVPPGPYIKEGRRRPAARRGAPWGGPTRSPSRIPPTWARLGMASSPSLLYIWRGAPTTQINCSKPCAAPPSIVYASGHIHVVLRRSPARITSPSPSPRRRADATLPRHFWIKSSRGIIELNVCRTQRCRTFGA